MNNAPKIFSLFSTIEIPMKRILLAITFVFSLLPMVGMATTINVSASEAASGIIGEWRLHSYERNGRVVDSYQDNHPVWRFDGSRLSVESQDLGRRIEGHYSVKRSVFRIRNTVLIMSSALRETHLPHGKFVVRSLEGDTLTITDWNESLLYTLQRSHG